MERDREKKERKRKGGSENENLPREKMGFAMTGHLDWKPDKIRVFQSFLYLCDVNMMLKIEPATFPTPKWMRLKSLSKCGNISLGLPGW